MELRGIMGGFYRISEWIMRFSVINVLWVIFSVPFFYLLLVFAFTPNMTADMVKQMLILLGIISPFTLIPATAAMFSVARKWVMGDVDVPLFKTFVKGYKENYKQSMLGGILFLLISTVLFVNFKFYGTREGALNWLSQVFIVFQFIVLAAFLNFLSLSVHFHLKLLQAIKNAFIITIGQPLTTFSFLAANAIIFIVSFKFTFLIPFFTGSLCAFATLWFFYKGIQRIQLKAEAYQEQQEEETAADSNTDGENEHNKK